MLWEMAVEQPPPQSCQEFAAAFVEWAEITTTHTAFVAVEGGEVVGFAWLAQVPRPPGPGMRLRANGDLQTVHVRPPRRNVGVGDGLIRAVLAHSWEQGLGAVTVAANERASSFYRRIGFRCDPLDLRLVAPAPDRE